MKTEVKIFKHRVSAERAIQKAGIAPEDCVLFVKPTLDGQFIAEITRAKEQVKRLAPKKWPGKQPKVKKEREGHFLHHHPGLGAFCEDLILSGASNKEVLEEVKGKFKVEIPFWYPRWYRGRLKRQERLPVEFDHRANRWPHPKGFYKNVWRKKD